MNDPQYNAQPAPTAEERDLARRIVDKLGPIGEAMREDGPPEVREAMGHIDTLAAGTYPEGGDPLRDTIVSEEQWDAVPGTEYYATGDGPEAVVGISPAQHLTALSLNEYQDKALVTAMYPEKGTGSAMALAYVALGLGEAGEIQGKVKKLIRDDNSVVSNEKRLAIAMEYGDLLWYVATGVKELGLTLEDVALANLEKLASRKERGTLTGSGDNR